MKKEHKAKLEEMKSKHDRAC